MTDREKYLLEKEQVCGLDKGEKYELEHYGLDDEKINKALLVEYLYTDEMDDEQMLSKPRCSYIVYAEAGTEVGEEIRTYLDADEAETDFIRLDNVLDKHFGITDEDCCFYILDLEDASIEAIKKEVLDSNDMVILDVIDVIKEER